MRNLLFNKRDRKLLEELPEGDPQSHSKKAYRLFNYHMHPRGIKELVNPKGIRVANLMRNLLYTLEEGNPEDRLKALHSLRDEVFFSSQGSMSKNTARALLSVMKDLLREEDDEQRRLELAYDFHTILTGKPAMVRKFLKKYHLLEMPEEWNQLTFDHHVHDAHTKGRKTPTHLIMDAWIKGIRSLTVIYYDFIPPEAAEEMITAASYMEINLRIGMELKADYQGKGVSLIWIPRGFTDAEGFLRFIERTDVAQFMKEGRKRSRVREKNIFTILKIFNQKHRKRFNRDYGIDLPEIDIKDFKNFVGNGQASMLHLSEFIFQKALPLLKERQAYCNEAMGVTTGEEKEILKIQNNKINNCISEQVFDEYLKELVSIREEFSEVNEKTPSPAELIKKLDTMHSGYRLTLNLTGLHAEDVLVLIYLCKGHISGLEIYNHKDWAQGLDKEVPRIRSFQHPLNNGNTIALKRAILSFIKECEKSDDPYKKKQIKNLNLILNDLPGLLRYYESHPIADRWGSDSTGRSSQLYGMGLAVLDTLPRKTQKEIRKRDSQRILPIYLPVKRRRTYSPSLTKRFFNPKENTPSWSNDYPDGTEWLAQPYSTDKKGANNVIALGWKPQLDEPEFEQEPITENRQSLSYKWRYLDSNIKNLLKVFIGFIPAFLTFFLTKEWWVLAYLGAPIWFGITGLRNILQSVIGGDSLHRSPLLSWNSYVNWSRVSDSLLYTGFSVPLLDFLIKNLLLDKGFGINTSSNVLALFGIMALVNGIYISSHNLLRGLPPAAIAGNFFRSILSIPLAIAFNFILEGLLSSLGVIGAALILQKWAAVVSKAASDCVAGFIEGTADRNRNILLRRRDYQRKINQMYASFVRMELLLPEENVLHLLKNPKKLTKAIKIEDPELLESSIYDALDLLYFWYYQPHARTELKHLVKQMSLEERLIFMRFQHVLERKKLICNLFLEGFLGKNYSKAMAFYLSRENQYIESLNKLLKY
ncbi:MULTISPECIES: hypothetical protein [unclassified Oceanispirochaeta]|uniref:hypothetical protein n=1 Tax=unclassified Oceanispirochaeta TaxID=2635722 RepID=UPI000E092920|nr:MULTISPECIES: hypothetical protein [unclassified Oceanispirochaeta]MBF9016998.1 hypothetical protein [Oceanispirochaeta sp. M2]NPD73361.1 hypothetical protein [Oceanispirochaeta sp. M1]RDG31018.1 hypothetical protein DV872_14765 [Oceanispirochaeta sp. M1]